MVENLIEKYLDADRILVKQQQANLAPLAKTLYGKIPRSLVMLADRIWKDEAAFALWLNKFLRYHQFYFSKDFSWKQLNDCEIKDERRLRQVLDELQTAWGLEIRISCGSLPNNCEVIYFQLKEKPAEP